MILVLDSPVLLPFCVIYLEYYVLNIILLQAATIELQWSFSWSHHLCPSHPSNLS